MPVTNELKVTYKDTDSLIPYARNAKIHDDKNVNEIAGSIRAFGFANPVLIDGSNGIVAGHGRVLAAKKLGIAKCRASSLTALRTRKSAPISLRTTNSPKKAAGIWTS
ncbi:MAG: ParB/Srx family N-terminal domain-containing protein [Succinivibrio sp.]|nr:ParB/Srx family N-terminal domain-containing protein [Succinivibrio sp.]